MEKSLQLGIYSSAGIGVLALLLGIYLTRKIPFLKRFCIPAPVSGGLLVSLLGMVIGLVLGVLLVWAQQHWGLVPMPGNFIVTSYPVVLQVPAMIRTAIVISGQISGQRIM